MMFFIADAFSEELFGGNPAGVVVIPEGADYPSSDTMLKTAAELRYSETAFIKRLGESEYQVRYFTPAAEVDLCGHATIATFYALAKAGLLTAFGNNDNGEKCNPLEAKIEKENKLQKVKAKTLAGDIEIEVTYSDTGTPEFVMMEMAEPKHIYTISDAVELDRLYEILGTEFDNSIGLLPMIISTGLPDIIVPVSSREELNSLNPNFELLAQLSKAYNVTGVHAFCLNNQGGNDAASTSGNKATGEASNSNSNQAAPTCYTRNFAPLYEIDEEAATGTASGALTFYLCLNEKIGVNDECTFIQGEVMGRPSKILTTINAGEKCIIKVGGKAALLAEGEINI